jgi:hypothetical protein
LVEILIYFVLLAVGVFVAMNFAITVGDLYGQSANHNELQSNADLLENRFTYAVQTATGVTVASSSFDVDEGVLTLTMEEVSQSPTVFYLQNGVVYMQQGLDAAMALTGPSVQVDYFRLTQVTATKAPTQIQLDAQLSVFGVQRESMASTIPIHLTVTLRQ